MHRTLSNPLDGHNLIVIWTPIIRHAWELNPDHAGNWVQIQHTLCLAIGTGVS